jgi:hypothetical protein
VPEFADPERRILICVDMESYSRRNNVLQHRAQLAFTKILNEATDELGLNRVNWQIQQGGDGELAILPAGANERMIVTRLAPVIDRLLREHNTGLEPEAKVRLRVAIHQGLVHLDGTNGFPSEAVVHVCRLADAPALKETLRRFREAAVALIVSDPIFQEVVRHYRDLRPEQFAQVPATIPDKGFEAPAWIYVPGENAAEPDGQDGAHLAPPGRGRGEPVGERPSPPTGSQVFQDIVSHGPTQFGNQNTQNNWNRPDNHGRTR